MQTETHAEYVPAPIPPAPEKVTKLDKLLCAALGGHPVGTYYPYGTKMETAKRWQVDYVPLWALPPYNLAPLEPKPISMKFKAAAVLDETLLPALAKEVRRTHRRLGYKVARVSVGAIPGGDGETAPLASIWERQGF
jgi:peptidoglycan/xylan/chitin deacetylase (PgdA/CDA1 family)